MGLKPKTEIFIKGLMKDGYKLASKCGLWTDIYKKITETKILIILSK